MDKVVFIQVVGFQLILISVLTVVFIKKLIKIDEDISKLERELFSYE